MSSTKLLGIKKEGWLGEEIKSYKNGMLFVPTVCDTSTQICAGK